MSDEELTNRSYTRRDLEKFFKSKLNRYIDLKWFIKQEKAGRLICPRDPHNNWRRFSYKEMIGIAKAFSPGGKGYWRFEE